MVTCQFDIRLGSMGIEPFGHFGTYPPSDPGYFFADFFAALLDLLLSDALDPATDAFFRVRATVFLDAELSAYE